MKRENLFVIVVAVFVIASLPLSYGVYYLQKHNITWEGRIAELQAKNYTLMECRQRWDAIVDEALRAGARVTRKGDCNWRQFIENLDIIYYSVEYSRKKEPRIIVWMCSWDGVLWFEDDRNNEIYSYRIASEWET